MRHIEDARLLVELDFVWLLGHSPSGVAASAYAAIGLEFGYVPAHVVRVADGDSSGLVFFLTHYALAVGGKNFDYLWILSRAPEISEEVKQEYLEYAQALGYDVSNLVWVEQDSLQ